MQQSLKKYVRPGARSGPAQDKQPQAYAPEQAPARKGSLLVSALASQLQRGAPPPTGAVSCRSAGPASGVEPLQERPPNLPAGQQQQQQQQQRQQQEKDQQAATQPKQPRPQPDEQAAAPSGLQASAAGSSAARADTAGLMPCPLCGVLLLPGEQLQEHMEQELLQLEQQEEDADDWGEQHGDQPAGQQQQRPPQAMQRHRDQQQQRQDREQQQHAPPPRQQLERQRQQQQQPQRAAVLVLGGAPALTAPTDRRRLQQLQRERLLPPKRPRVQPVENFNFFDDGSGAWVRWWWCRRDVARAAGRVMSTSAGVHFLRRGCGRRRQAAHAPSFVCARLPTFYAPLTQF